MLGELDDDDDDDEFSTSDLVEPISGAVMATAPGDVSSGAIDTKILNKPGKFAGQRERFGTWKFALLNYIRLLSPVLRQAMDEAELKTSEITMDRMSEEMKQRSKSLYSFLAQQLFLVVLQMNSSWL